jgi:hypothetical protein
LNRDTSLEVGLDGSVVPVFPVSTSSAVIPDTAKVVGITYGYQKTVDIDGNRADLLNLNIADPTGEENFYGVTAFYIRRLEAGSMPTGDTIMIFLRSDGLVIEGVNPDFFNDATFDVKETSIRINSQIYSGGTDTEQHILVRVYAFPKAYYLY